MIRVSTLAGLLIVGLAVMVGTGTSQEKKGKAKGQLPAGWTKLNLSDAQKEKIYEVQGNYRMKIKSLQDQIDQLKVDQRAAEVKVLTNEQQDMLKKIALGEGAKKEKDKDK